MMVICFICAIISLAITCLATFASIGIGDNLLDLHLSCPLAIFPFFVTLFWTTLGIILINPIISFPLGLIYSVIGYMFSLKWFGMFINSRTEGTKETILNHNISKYFFPILIIYFWPFILIYLSFKKITKGIDILTPGKIFDEIKKKD